jgi:hypothetical protein
MSEFLYLFRGGDNPQASPEAMQQHMMKWVAWIDQLTRDGVMKAGEPLQGAGRVLSGPRGQLVTDGPFTESKEVVGGFLHVRATDLDRAVEIARGCPIFEHGGTVEVRPIQPMDLPHHQSA